MLSYVTRYWNRPSEKMANTATEAMRNVIGRPVTSLAVVPHSPPPASCRSSWVALVSYFGCSGQKANLPNTVTIAGTSVNPAISIRPMAMESNGPSAAVERSTANDRMNVATSTVPADDAIASPTARIVARIASCLSSIRFSSSRNRDAMNRQ